MNTIPFDSLTLNERAYSEIKKRIINREFQPGQRLVDSQLAEAFGISRTPIRDAMRKLTDEGLLINTTSRGFYVFYPSLKDLEEIFDISEMIELAAAKKIIATLNGRNFHDMEDKLTILEEKANIIDLVDDDEEFKRYMIDIADNKRLYDIYLKNQSQRVLLANIIFYDKSGEARKNRIEKSRMVHNKIIYGLKTLDLAFTSDAIAEHTNYGRQDAIQYINQLSEILPKK